MRQYFFFGSMVVLVIFSYRHLNFALQIYIWLQCRDRGRFGVNLLVLHTLHFRVSLYKSVKKTLRKPKRNLNELKTSV